MQPPLDRCLNALYTSHTFNIPKIQNKMKLNRNLIRGKPNTVKHHRSEVCVEPNDAKRHKLHEPDAEISKLESEILVLKVEGKKLLILSEM